MSDKLTKALLELATSTVKQDRLAVERLEKQYGANLGRILNELEEYTIVHQVFEDQRLNPKKQLMIICANGCLVGAIIGILTKPFGQGTGSREQGTVKNLPEYWVSSP